MRATLVLFLASGAALGAVSVSPARAATTHGAVPLAQSRTAADAAPLDAGAAGPGDPSTTVTFTVTSGALTLSVPAAANLGSGAPGTTIAAPIGPCTVTDARALASASWTVTAAQTDFSNGTQIIPAGDDTYTVGTVTTTGTITVTPTNITLSNSAQTVLTGSAGVGDNTASWNPTLAVSVPAAAVAGTYNGTLTQSVA
jgi:hypothetical protein